MPNSLSAARRAGRQGPKAELSETLAQLYRELHKQQAEVSLPEFMRLAALLVDAPSPHNPEAAIILQRRRELFGDAS